jgi:hypothetical protein
MRFDLPEDKKLSFEMVIPIRWGDMDAMGRPIIEGQTLDESPNS